MRGAPTPPHVHHRQLLREAYHRLYFQYKKVSETAPTMSLITVLDGVPLIGNEEKNEPIKLAIPSPYHSRVANTIAKKKILHYTQSSKKWEMCDISWVRFLPTRNTKIKQVSGGRLNQKTHTHVYQTLIWILTMLSSTPPFTRLQHLAQTATRMFNMYWQVHITQQRPKMLYQLHQSVTWPRSNTNAVVKV